MFCLICLLFYFLLPDQLLAEIPESKSELLKQLRCNDAGFDDVAVRF